MIKLRMHHWKSNSIKENVKEWIRPDGDPGIIVEKALSNMAFEKAVEYHRSPMEFITVRLKRRMLYVYSGNTKQ